MAAVFNAREVFEIAEQIERNGARFYRRAAEITDWPEAANVLLRLAEMEDEHEVLFQSLKEEFTDAGNGDIPDVDEQALSYLQAMAEGKVFSNRDDLASQLIDSVKLEEVYRMAIGFEKDSIVFFSAIKKLIPNDLGKVKIDALITEEVGHVVMLSRELKVCCEK